MIRRAACQGVRVRWLSSQPAAGRRTHWTRELDERLRRLVAERGRAWKSIAADLGIEGSPLKVRSRWEVLQPKKRDVWTGDEDRALVQAIAEYTQGSRALGEYGSWVSIARRLGTGRTPAQCQTRWTYTLLPRQGKVVPFTRFKGVRGWMWSDDEEARLRRVVDATVNVDDPPEAVARAASEEPWLLLGIGSSGCMGQQFWIYVASRVGTRTANQCKRKWHSLSDAKGPGRFTISDARRMAELVAVHGRKWEFLAREHFPGVRPLDIQLHYNRWRQLEERHGVSLLEIDPLSMLKDYDGRSALRPTGPDGHYDPNGPLVRACLRGRPGALAPYALALANLNEWHKRKSGTSKIKVPGWSSDKYIPTDVADRLFEAMGRHPNDWVKISRSLGMSMRKCRAYADSLARQLQSIRGIMHDAEIAELAHDHRAESTGGPAHIRDADKSTKPPAQHHDAEKPAGLAHVRTTTEKSADPAHIHNASKPEGHGGPGSTDDARVL